MGMMLVIIFAISVALPTGLSESYDYLTMAQRWSVTHCMSKKGTPEACTVNPIAKDQFKIHGLWPSNKNFNDPYDCDRSNKLNQKDVSFYLYTYTKILLYIYIS